MPILDPITTPPKFRDFAVIDLEWVPGEPLDPPEHTEILIDGMRDMFRIPMPVGIRQTKPLQIRLASCYDQVPECEASDYDDDPVRVERFVCFPTVKELLDDILVRENRHKWFFAHAGGLSDMEFVLDELLTQIKTGIAAQNTVTVRIAEGDLREKGVTKHEDWGKDEWKVRASFSGSSAIIVHLAQGKNAWHFIDSYWLLRDKLANIGKAIGIKKGDGPLAAVYLQQRFSKESLEKLSNQELEDFYRECPMDVLIEYNRVDCEILWKAIQQFEHEIIELGGQLQQTIASTGMSLCRRAYLKQTIYTSEKINKISELSYYASRVEVISRNLENFKTYDINSSFPYSMTFPQPGGLKRVGTRLPDDDSETCIYIADVDIEVPDMPLPPVPYRSGGRVFFPVGRWRAWFTSTDIKLALREGCILHKVYEVYEFEPFYDLKGYVDDIYAKRAAADTEFRKLVLKYLLNCLYGKYAESPMKQEMLINPDDLDREEMQLLQPGIWLRDRSVTIDHRHVPISTHITSLSRRTLFDYGKMCYAQGKPSAYFDSITAERTVVLRSPGGRIYIDPVQEVWELLIGCLFENKGEKEVKNVPFGWTALARDAQGRDGWFPLKKVLRHRTMKDIYLLSSKRGQVRVTSDHSLIVDGRRVRPSEFISRGMQFDTVKAPSVVPAAGVDLFEYVCGFSRVHTRGLTKVGVSEDDGGWLILESQYCSVGRIKRFYKSGSPEMAALLRILGAYISEGSSSLKHVTTGTRDMFSICQNDESWLCGLKKDLEFITSGLSFFGPKWSERSKVYYLRSGASLLPMIFSAIAGYRSDGKRLPSFVYELTDSDFGIFWDKLMEGDGTTDVSGRSAYTTKSQRLMAGLSFALSQRGQEHLFHYRKDKKCYLLRFRPKGSERRRSKLHVERMREDGYVYDLEVEGAHTFVDGLGRVLLHNTDSLNTCSVLPCDDKKLGALKLEKKMEWGEFFAPKIYRGEGFEIKKNGTVEPIKQTKAKGFSLGKSKQEAWERFDRIVSGERIGIQRMVRLRELYRSGMTAPIDILVIKALTFEMLSKRFQFPDGETRPWSVQELLSGEVYPKGFDFDAELLASLDTTTRSMIQAAF